MANTATYTHLKDGSWGIRTTATARPGATFIVQKKSGETRTETVGRVIWTGNGVSICAITPSKQPAGSSRAGRRYECEECGEWHTPNDGTVCWETGCRH